MAPSDSADTSTDSKMRELDRALHAIGGFHIDVISSHLVSARLTVTQTCCQPFGYLHGGVSALITETLGSIGATVAAGFTRVAGIQLSINHLKSAQVGDCILAEATPVNVGRTIQVWQVGLWKAEPPNGNAKGVMVASSRITLICNLPIPKGAADKFATVRKHARL